MMWALRDRFPLHCIVFKQTACHLPHEANVEQLFSRAGMLTDPNMDPHFLATLTSIAINKSACNPHWERIKSKYFDKSAARARALPKGRLGQAALRLALLTSASRRALPSLDLAYSLPAPFNTLRITSRSERHPPMDPCSHAPQPQTHRAPAHRSHTRAAKRVTREG